MSDIDVILIEWVYYLIIYLYSGVLCWQTNSQNIAICV